MSYEKSQEELFNRLLADLEKSTPEISASFFAAIKTPLASLERAALTVHCSGPDIIKVMKSGMFHMGGLKGRKLPGENPFKVYFFEDLAYFILKVTNNITSGELLENLKKAFRRSSPFDEAIKQIEELEYIAKVYRSKRSSNELTEIKKGLQNIQARLLDKPIIVLPAQLKEMPDRVDNLISLFKDQLPSATPDYTIAVAISYLLNTFNIFIEHTAILRRIERRKE